LRNDARADTDAHTDTDANTDGHPDRQLDDGER
jgi:hypothetical protein